MIRAPDVVAFGWRALRGHRLRTGLMLLAMAIGVAAVGVLTSLGEGARGFVVNEFASLGTNLLIVIPGRNETTGDGPPMLVGTTTRDLTLDDAIAVGRLAQTRRMAPIVLGSADVSHGARERQVAVLGSSHELIALRQWRMAQGRFLPVDDLDRASPVIVLGSQVKQELFGREPAIGRWVRLGERRFRVIGVLAEEGRSLGMDVKDLVVIPVASAQALFNAPSLFRIFVEVSSRPALAVVEKRVVDLLRVRHQGEEDVTVITQDAMLETFDRILRTLTLAVVGIAAISLAVAGILIMNVMLVAVSQRNAEIGLLKALGATPASIMQLFLVEAALLSLLGSLLGLLVGKGLTLALAQYAPQVPFGSPWWADLSALAVALVTGLLFGAMPARRAARLDPVMALARH